MSTVEAEPTTFAAAPVAERTPSKSALKRRFSRKIAADLVGVADIAAVLTAFIFPAIIYNHAGGIVSDWRLLVQGGFAAALIVHMLLRFNGMYTTDRMHDFPTRPGLLLAVVAVTLLGLLGIGVPNALRDQHQWVWLCVALSASYTFLLFNRGFANVILANLTRKGYFDERVAVFGAGQIARRVKEHLEAEPAGIYFAGLFDDRMGTDRINPEGLAVAGRLDDLIAVARNNEIDKIIIALPQSADQRISDVARKLESLPVSLHAVTHIASDLIEGGPAHAVSAVGSVGLLDVKKKPLDDWQPLLKRLEDVLVGSFLLLITLPMFPIIAAAIKLDSPGPVMFRQRRSGLNRKPVEILKFRTMSVEHAADEARQATSKDKRVTRVGRILRRTSLDELPQLINVVKGDMSLVGPRPHLAEHDERFARMVDTYAFRHQVKPGLTGLAQVSGYRGEVRTPANVVGRVNADIRYIRNWSLWLDAKILLRTVWAVATGRNAY